jgi:hypothetical protein
VRWRKALEKVYEFDNPVWADEYPELYWPSLHFDNNLSLVEAGAMRACACECACVYAYHAHVHMHTCTYTHIYLSRHVYTGGGEEDDDEDTLYLMLVSSHTETHTSQAPSSAANTMEVAVRGASDVAPVDTGMPLAVCFVPLALTLPQ